MKKSFAFVQVTAMFAVLIVFFACRRNADTPPQNKTDKWVINDMKTSLTKTYTEAVATSFTFRLTQNSTCPVYNVKAIITVNNQEVLNKTYISLVTPPDEVIIPVPPGAAVTVTTERVNVGGQVICFWGGEAKFEIEKK